MPKARQENHQAWDAMNEGIVVSVITLYDKFQLARKGDTRRNEISDVLHGILKMDTPDINYWLDYYNIK
jgi:hypothetical protein